MLIFPNGTAHFDVAGVNDIGDDGLPIQGNNFTLSARCYIEAGSEHRRGKNEDGQYPVGSYVVSIDYDSVNSSFNPKKIKLEHERKGDLGTFTIQRIEYYDLTRTIQIWT